MGKRVLVSLLAMALIFLASRPGTAQDAQNPTPEEATEPASKGFQPGSFLTQEDFEHIEAALGCINLTPKDLEYNKVLRDDAYRLKVCDQSLNDPLSVPQTAEDAAKAFSAKSTPTWRSMKAGELLGLPHARWRPDELRKDGKYPDGIQRKIDDNWKKLDELGLEGVRELEKKVYAQFAEYLVGGTAKDLVVADEIGTKVFSGDPLVALMARIFPSLNAHARTVDQNSLVESRALGVWAPSMFEAPDTIPDAEGEFEDVSPFDTAANVDLPGAFVSGCRLSMTLSDLSTQLLAAIRSAGSSDTSFVGLTTHDVEGVTGGVICAFDGPWGRVVVGGDGPNVYEGDDFVAIIDLGGDDTYRGRVASGIGYPGRSAISFVLDLAGDDRYLGEDFTQGFGFLGVGILHDLGGGDDVYKSRFCAQGCGLCGYGELYDDGGDDTYTTDSGSQGAGCFGYGQLTDKSGNDVYRGCRYTQGFAQVMGVGVLTDGAGNDLYYAGGKYLHQPLWNDRYQSLSQGFAIGNRYGETGGGVALLLDEGDGNDVYQADIYGQGSSYWYSLGMLVDTGGNDTYTLGQYGQGGGIHLSTGILVDLKGNDTYSNPYGVGLGGAHDWAVGWLIDRAGDDLYQGNGQGQGLNFAVGILMDCAGNDSHSTNNANSIGKGTNNDISLLLDFAGTDVYGPTDVVDGKFNRRGEHQIVYDVPEGWFPGLDESTLPTKQDAVPESVTVQHILIAWDGTGVDTQKAKRTKAEAQALAQDVLKLARKKGADWKQLQTDYNEDSGVDGDGAHNEYKATPDARLVKPFKDLALSLGVGQIDVCETKFGYHIIKRIE